MVASIPMIRAAAIAPMRRWLIENGRDAAAFLSRADLDWVPADEPLLPIPLHCAVDLLVGIARAEGPDAPHRIISGRGGFEIGLIGLEAFRGETVREGLHNVARAMPLHCTHEIFVVADVVDGLHVSDGWITSMKNDEALHLVQQYVAALVQMICSVAAGSHKCLKRVGMVPHPETGLAHLRPWLEDRVFANEARTLDVALDNSVADLPFPASARREADRMAFQVPEVLRQGRTLSADVTALLSAMLPFTRPTIARVAAAASMSARTLRRRLRDEGSSFTTLLERTRADIALSRLEGEDPPLLKDLAAELGYADQATLTRAVRRWTGSTPRDLRPR